MKNLNVGMIGAGFMAKAYSVAFQLMPIWFFPPPAMPMLKEIADIDEKAAKLGARRYRYERWASNWRDLTSANDIDLIVVATPNLFHREQAIAAAEAGKHVLCEKPLAMNSHEAREMYDAVKRAGVKHLVGFNYRRVPAVVFAKHLIDEGLVGRVYHFRGYFLTDFAIDPNVPFSWRFESSVCGSGAIGDIGSHIIDFARYVVGDFDSVVAATETFIDQRPMSTGATDTIVALTSRGERASKVGKVDVDDAAIFLARFRNGALGSIEASRFATGRKFRVGFEVNGSKGAVCFDFERMNELLYYSVEDPDAGQGFKRIVCGPAHPYGRFWWPLPGFNIGWEETKVNEIYDFTDAIVNVKEIEPSFYDGWKVNEVIDAVIESRKKGAWVSLPD